MLARAAQPVILAGDAVAQSDAHAELVAVAEALGAPVYAEGVANTASFPASHPLFRGAVRPDRAGGAPDPVGGRRPVLGGRRSPDALAPVRPRSHAAGPRRDPPRHRSLGAREELPDRRRDPRRSEGDAARSPRGDREPADVRQAPAGAGPARGGPGGEDAPPGGAQEPGSSRGAADADDVTRRDRRRGRGAAPEAVVVDESISSARRPSERSSASDDPQSFFGLRGGGIGWGLPAAIGVQLALPDRPVVGLIGDGSAMYTCQALWTAARYRLRRHVRHPEQRVLPHPQAADARDEGSRGPGRPLRRHGPRRPARRLRAPGRVARRAGRADREGEPTSARRSGAAIAAPGPTLLDVELDRSFKPA